MSKVDPRAVRVKLLKILPGKVCSVAVSQHAVNYALHLFNSRWIKLIKDFKRGSAVKNVGIPRSIDASLVTKLYLIHSLIHSSVHSFICSFTFNHFTFFCE